MSQPGVKPREKVVLLTIRTLKVCNKKLAKIECDGPEERAPAVLCYAHLVLTIDSF